jgi:hypothetical protein
MISDEVNQRIYPRHDNYDHEHEQNEGDGLASDSSFIRYNPDLIRHQSRYGRAHHGGTELLQRQSES